MISVHLWNKSTYIWKGTWGKEQSFYIFTQTSATALAIGSPKPLLCIWQEMDDKGKKAERNSSVWQLRGRQTPSLLSHDTSSPKRRSEWQSTLKTRRTCSSSWFPSVCEKCSSCNYVTFEDTGWNSRSWMTRGVWRTLHICEIVIFLFISTLHCVESEKKLGFGCKWQAGVRRRLRLKEGTRPGALSLNANEDGMKLLLEHEMWDQQN